MVKRISGEPSVIGWMSAGVGLCLLLTFVMRWALHDEREKDPIVVMGGGFLFNYRISEISYGLTAGVARAIPVGSRLVATFEDPGADLRSVARKSWKSGGHACSCRAARCAASSRTAPITSRCACRARTGEKLWGKELTYRTHLDASLIGDEPLTIGPGYFPNPKLRTRSADG